MKLYVKTHGCQMNVYDSSRMADALRASHGARVVDDPAQADVLLLNTCSIREKAAEKVFSELGRWKSYKRTGDGVLIGVGGCVASQEGAAITARAPYVDMVFGPQTLHRLPAMIDRARALKAAPDSPGGDPAPLAGRTLAMIFEKPSTRTRVSFEVGMKSLGGSTVVLNPNDMQIGRGETIGDTARVLSRYVDAIMIRTFEAETLATLAEHAAVPVINGLTGSSHPCQLMADVMTFEEHRGPIGGRRQRNAAQPGRTDKTAYQ